MAGSELEKFREHFTAMRVINGAVIKAVSTSLDFGNGKLDIVFFTENDRIDIKLHGDGTWCFEK